MRDPVSAPQADIAQLRAEIAALEQLLEIQESTVAEQTSRLEVQSSELRRSNHALEQFAYVISHDLQEPLRMVAAYTELLRESYRGKLGDDADKYIDFASGGARRMQELINALLDYSRVTTRGKDFTLVSLDEILDEALLNLALTVEESKAEITRTPLPSIKGDRSQLTRLLQNLMGNALKFREPDSPPRVSIGVSNEGDFVDLAVSDQGIGIDPRHHARIFEVFRRIHPKRFAGTGIGLSICQRIAERHGGGIRVDSALGRGATFHVTLLRTKESP
jgi:light-regulated signal transduction histidine kinase (bacteriophytochrome)